MSITIQQASDAITPSIPNAPFAETVDTVKSGDTSQPLTGITVTFLVNCKVIEQAAQLGANLIVTRGIAKSWLAPARYRAVAVSGVRLG